MKVIPQEFQDMDGETALRVTTDQSFDHTVVEGLMASVLQETHSVMHDLFHNMHDPKIDDISRWVESAYHTFRYVVANGVEVLAAYPLDALKPKQRDFRVLMNEFVRRLGGNNPLVDGGVFSDVQFGKDLVGFLGAGHACLLEQTSRDDRRRAKRQYKAGKSVTVGL